MSEMVERVARAIATAQWGAENATDEAWRELCDDYDLWAEARAAIEAMREPTKQMVEAADYYFDRGSPVVPWQDMIDEALKG